MWKQQLRNVIQPFLAHEYVPVVLSPDMDGVVATLVLHRYAKQFNQGVRVIGTYDSRTVMAATSSTKPKTHYGSISIVDLRAWRILGSISWVTFP